MVFNPPIDCPKDTVIFLEIYPKINVGKRWNGYISLENSLGEEKRTFTRKKVIIINRII